MDRKIDAASLVVAASALLLVIALFLDWYGLGSNNVANAFEVFEVLDLVLLFAALAAVAAAFGRLDSRVLLGAAAVAVVVVVSQLIDPPPAAQGADREIGAWLALVAAAGLVASAALAAAQIAVTVDVRGRERRLRVASVDKRGSAAPAQDGPTRGGRSRDGSTHGGPVTVHDELETPAGDRDDDATVADRFAPETPPHTGSRAVDPDATQAFATPPDDPAR